MLPARSILLAALIGTFTMVRPLWAEPVRPSFDCAKATALTERLICGSDTLAGLDREMGTIYQRRSNEGDAGQRDTLLGEQRQWLRDRSVRCNLPARGDIGTEDQSRAGACLGDLYRVRIAELAAGSPTRWAEVDNYPASSRDKWVVLLRILSDMERVAAGKPRAPLVKGAVRDPTEALVDAYVRFLAGDFAGMDGLLDSIGLTAWESGRSFAVAAVPHHNFEARETAQQVEQLLALSRHASPLVRLIARFWRAHASLKAEALAELIAAAEPIEDDGKEYWALKRLAVRLPCRTVVGRVAEFGAAAQAARKGARDLISCPGRPSNFQKAEQLALDVAMLEPVPYRPKHNWWADWFRGKAIAGKPLEREDAVARMGEDPDRAEPVLQRAAEADAVGKLDLILFLYAFRPTSPARDEKISALVAEVAGLIETSGQGRVLSRQPDLYDGTEESLITTVVNATIVGIADITDKVVATMVTPYPYALPCAVLVARPSLLAATEQQFGSISDRSLPRSGCSWGRGAVPGFPADEIEAFMEAVGPASGNRRAYSLPYIFDAMQLGATEGIFRHVTLNHSGYPFQQEGYASLERRDTVLRIKASYEKAYEPLLKHNRALGMNADVAARVTAGELFEMVKPPCNWEPPSESLRSLIIEGAAVAKIESLLATTDVEDLVSPYGDADDRFTYGCGDGPRLDPVLLVSVDYLPGLVALLGYARAKGMQDFADTPNSYGQTALMIAAERDRRDSVALLLQAGARINRAAWPAEGPGWGGGGTALMHAAAAASLPTIEMLLAAGADRYQTDTSGLRAVDWLMGYHGLPPNPKLTPEELVKAAKLLF